MKLNLKKTLPQAIGAAAGGAAASLLVDKVLSGSSIANVLPAQVRPVVPFLLGLLLGGNKNPFVAGAGLGMAGVAGSLAARSLTTPSAPAAGVGGYGYDFQPTYTTSEFGAHASVNGTRYEIGAANAMGQLQPLDGPMRTTTTIMGGQGVYENAAATATADGQ